MRVRIGWALSILLLAALALAGVAWAQVSPNASTALSASHDLSWHVLSSGGQDSASSAHQVRGTLGQLAIGPAAVSGGHAVGSGYWYGIRIVEPQPVEYEIYLPIVIKGAGR